MRKKDLREKDDAVSPVIALMLILAILATCMAVYTTTYVPGLKQQDEITHTGEVRRMLTIPSGTGAGRFTV